MVTTSGNLFHIDFGHFLGNIKYIMVQNHFHGNISLSHMVPLPPSSLSLSLLSSLHRASKESGLHLSSPQTLCGSWEERYTYLAESDPFEVFMAKISLQDSSTFETYKNLCCRAFLILRRHSDLIINLFSLVSSLLNFKSRAKIYHISLSLSLPASLLSPFPFPLRCVPQASQS